MSDKILKIVLVYPDLLGTYGDSGNAEILVARAKLRGINAVLVTVSSTQPVPLDGDVYVLGGGEDGPQQAAVTLLRKDGGLERAHSNGAQILAICAGFQILGVEFPISKSGSVAGLGLLPVRTLRSTKPRCVGELMVDPDPSLGVPLVSGYENHAGQTEIISGKPLGRVVYGVGNSYESGCDGYLDDTVIASYCHGPMLARNPGIADVILWRALGTDLSEISDANLMHSIDDLRFERISSIGTPKYWKDLLSIARRLKQLL